MARLEQEFKGLTNNSHPSYCVLSSKVDFRQLRTSCVAGNSWVLSGPSLLGGVASGALDSNHGVQLSLFLLLYLCSLGASDPEHPQLFPTDRSNFFFSV